MKKLLFIISLILVIMLGACNSAPTDYYTQDEVDNLLEEKLEAYDFQLQNDLDILQYQITALTEQEYYTKDEIDTLISTVSNAITVLENDVFSNAELIDELEQILINIEVIEGLNGQKVYYIPDQSALITLSATSLADDKLDKTKAPSYIMDIDGNYIPFDDVVVLLLDKYFGDYNLILSEIGSKIMIQYFTDYTVEEFMVRTIFLIEELSHYDFYIIGSSEIEIYTNYEGTSILSIPIQTLRSTFITMDYEVFINGWYEVDLFNLNFDATQVQALYEQYVLDETFVGFVLDYKE